MKLTRQQESWVCVIQSLPEQFIPAELNLHGPKWPQDNISSKNLWMHKPLSERARAAIVASHQVGAAAEGSASKGDGSASSVGGAAPGEGKN